MDEGGEHRRVDAAFISATIFTLRARRMRVTPADAAICVLLARGRDRWRRDELAGALAGVLARGPADRAIIDETLREMFAPALQKPGQSFPPTVIKGPPPTTGTPAPKEKDWAFLLRWFAARGGALAAIVGATLIALLLLKTWPPISGPQTERPRQPDPRPPSQIELVQFIDSAFAALAIIGLGLLLWRARKLGLVKAPGAENVRSPPEPRSRRLDGTVFRVGAVGGEPRRFMSPVIGIEISELFGYRLGGVDLGRMDVRRTLEAVARSGDPASFVGQRTRELPQILVLIDAGSDARGWNTLAEEFLEVTRARGVSVRSEAFSRGFFERRHGLLKAGPAAIAVEDALDSTGWTVTLVFGEAKRLSSLDVALLRRVGESGPSLFLDYADRALWDGRHAALQAKGVPVVEATARELHKGLARIFAPDRGLGAVTPIVRPPQHSGRGPELDTFEALGKDGRDWASDCALIEPISFPMAERLRQAYPSLGPDASPSLAFSRLVALPGSWLGPEGLRFEPATRRRLLNHFAARDLGSRQEVMNRYEAAFSAVKPEGQSARAMFQFALDAARAFGPPEQADLALEALCLAEQEGVLAPAPINAFLNRLRTPDRRDATEDDVVMLPNVPRLPGVLTRLAPARQAASRTLPDWTAVPWSVSAPSTRLLLPPSQNFSSQDAPPLAAFLPGATKLILAGRAAFTPLPGAVALADLESGTVSAVTTPFDMGEATVLVAAWNAPVFAAGARDGRWQAYRLNPVDGLERLNIAGGPRETSETRAAMPAAIDADGSKLFYGSDFQIECVELAEPGARGQVRRCDAAVTALACSESALLVGLANGRVDRAPYDNFESGLSGSSIEVGGVPAALAVLRRPPALESSRSVPLGGDEILVIGRTDGLILAHDGYRMLSSVALGRAATRLVVVAEEAIETQRGSSPTLTSVTVFATLEGGGFDVIGLPLGETADASFPPMSLLRRPAAGSVRFSVLGIAALRRAPSTHHSPFEKALLRGAHGLPACRTLTTYNPCGRAWPRTRDVGASGESFIF